MCCLGGGGAGGLGPGAAWARELACCSCPCLSLTWWPWARKQYVSAKSQFEGLPGGETMWGLEGGLRMRKGETREKQSVPERPSRITGLLQAAGSHSGT